MGTWIYQMGGYWWNPDSISDEEAFVQTVYWNVIES